MCCHSVGFYGLDVYSLLESLEAILAHLRNIDGEEAVRSAVRGRARAQGRGDGRGHNQSLQLFCPAVCLLSLSWQEAALHCFEKVAHVSGREGELSAQLLQIQ